MKHLLQFVILIFAFTCSMLVKAQDNNRSVSKIIFQESESQEYGFDGYRWKEWLNQYDTVSLNYIGTYVVFNKSVGNNSTDLVDAVFLNKKLIVLDSLTFEIESSSENIRFIQKNDSTFTLFLPEKKRNYTINAVYKGNLKGQLNVFVFQPKLERIVIVPLVKMKINKDSINAQLNKIYKQANIQFDVQIKPFFKIAAFEKDFIMQDPSSKYDRFTEQMQTIRNDYFGKFSEADKKSYYIFVVPSFKSASVHGYMVQSKAIGFVKKGKDSFLAHTIARHLGHGMGILSDSWENGGPRKGTTDNLMDVLGGSSLNSNQWLSLRHATNSYSFYDNYEYVKTNRGMIAFYYWEENADGTIKLVGDDFLESIKRPYKKNFYSYHLEIDNVLFKSIYSFESLKFDVCALHIMAIVSVVLIAFLIRRKFHRYLRYKFRRSRLLRILSRLIFIGGSIITLIWFFYLIDLGYSWYEVNEGEIKVFHNYPFEKVKNEILYGPNIKEEFVTSLGSELLIKKGKKWFKKKRKKVLYFDIKEDSNGKWTICRFTTDSDSVSLRKLGIELKAESHYLVLNYLDANNKLKDQRLLNHRGIDLTTKIKLKDPARRILIFVNGYRPSSIGHSFKDYFADISKNGLEHKNSDNMIYDDDRFDYWNPWQEIDKLFKDRINPSETFYADGHFSVSTSNHGSLVNFSTLASVFPARCPNPKKHICYNTTIAGSGLLGSKTMRTNDMLRDLPSNTEGFLLRRHNGIIAGNNILQQLNEIPNKSNNDTLFIVAHSMGYAYSLGIIDVLRNRINFGGFYIIAPENAAAGNVQTHEWQEIWQYGSNLEKGKTEPACLQDGVAPQVRVGGLYPSHRVFIPEQNYKERGFFDSHFIGYYKWILDIKAGKPGAIRQR